MHQREWNKCDDIMESASNRKQKITYQLYYRYCYPNIRLGAPSHLCRSLVYKLLRWPSINSYDNHFKGLFRRKSDLLFSNVQDALPDKMVIVFQTTDALGLVRFSLQQEVTSTLRMLSYGVLVDQPVGQFNKDGRVNNTQQSATLL